MRSASFLSGRFITVIVVNPPESKLAKRITVQCAHNILFSGNAPLILCSPGQFVNDGICTACPLGFVPNGDQKTCKACPQGEVPDKDRMNCVPCSNPDEITELGECKACPSTHIPDYSRKKCVTCDFPKVSKAGNCIPCPACESMY